LCRDRLLKHDPTLIRFLTHKLQGVFFSR
jgi:hypothetical protein